MTIPTVTEIRFRPQAAGRNTFIADLSPRRRAA
jgi:hypothetical protein